MYINGGCLSIKSKPKSPQGRSCITGIKFNILRKTTVESGGRLLIKCLHGRSEKSTSFALEKDGKLLLDLELVNSLNNFYASVNADIPSLDLTTLPAYLPAADQVPYIEPHEVCKKLLAVDASKACGSDNIRARVLKEFAYVFAQPVASIFNTSLSSGIVPNIWKDSNITPIPKNPATN